MESRIIINQICPLNSILKLGYYSHQPDNQIIQTQVETQSINLVNIHFIYHETKKQNVELRWKNIGNKKIDSFVELFKFLYI
jgi:hypothetical protein